MLRTQKLPYPDWAAPYTAVWEGDQWICQFPTQADARTALRYIRQGDTDRLFPMLAVAPHPGGAGWYVGELHP